jgi:hypothetical protein
MKKDYLQCVSLHYDSCNATALFWIGGDEFSGRVYLEASMPIPENTKNSQQQFGRRPTWQWDSSHEKTALLALALIPIWAVRFPPVQDYPLHILRAGIITHYHDSASHDADAFVVSLTPITYVLTDYLLSSLAHLIPFRLQERLCSASMSFFFHSVRFVLVQPEMERRRSPLVSIPPFGRGFSRHGVFRSDGGWAAQERARSSSRSAHRDIPRHGCVPAVPASVSPGKIIVAPQRPAVSVIA